MDWREQLVLESLSDCSGIIEFLPVVAISAPAAAGEGGEASAAGKQFAGRQISATSATRRN